MPCARDTLIETLTKILPRQAYILGYVNMIFTPDIIADALLEVEDKRNENPTRTTP